jgi:uncharacterized membrane protein YhiD involved in acid resistance
MLDDFTTIFQFSLTFDEIVLNAVVALVCGLFIMLLYRYTYQGPSYSQSFAGSLVILSMLTAIVIMVIGNNLARAFGLVGAMSIIRFRTAIKDPQDIVYIFFSLATGMAAGAGMHLVALTGSAVVGFVTYVLSFSKGGAARRREFLLQFSMNGSGDSEDTYLPLIKKYCRDHKLINMKSINDGEVLELSFYIRLKDQDRGSAFVRDLEKTPGIERVNLFFDEENY